LTHPNPPGRELFGTRCFDFSCVWLPNLASILDGLFAIDFW